MLMFLRLRPLEKERAEGFLVCSEWVGLDLAESRGTYDSGFDMEYETA